MPTIISQHRITKEVKHWLTSPKREALFGPLGVTNIRTFVNPEDSSRVAVMMDVPDMEAFKTAVQSEAGAEAMEHDGVDPKSLLVMVEQTA